MGKSGKKKRVFFPFFMFLGVGLGFLLIEFFGASAVAGLMFVGMGLGFLFDSVITVEERTIAVRSTVKMGGIVYCIVGVIFIVCGALSMIDPKLLVNHVIYLMGLGFIVVGAYLLVSGFRFIEAASRKVEKSK